jgi:hypothetical protein
MSGENDKSMKWDRRRQARKAPQSFTFLQLERDEGGRVVNLSEEGLCFESFSPVRTANPVPLWFSFNLRDRIEATGQVVWTDSRKEAGGVAFINLSPSARQQIRSHLEQIPAEEAVPRNEGANREEAQPAFLPPAPAAGLAVVPRHGEASLHENLKNQEYAQSSANDLALPEVSDSPDQAPLIPRERFVAAKRSQFLRGLLLGILITAIVSIFAVKLALRSQPSTPKREGSAPSSPVDNPTSAPDPSTSKPTPNSSPASIKPSISSNSFSGTAPASLKNTDALRPPARETALQPASSNASAHPKLNLTPDELWAEVQSGNAKAAVALADLYLRGDGVPMNCAQARILLQFAAQRNNPEAIKKSRNLDKSGCPTP